MGHRHTVIYDGECRLCQRGIGWLRRLDWLDRFICLPADDPETARQYPELGMTALMTAVHCVSVTGSVTRGAEALRFIAARLPLLMPIGWLLHVPGALWVAERGYRWISRNRYEMGGRCAAGCRPHTK